MPPTAITPDDAAQATSGIASPIVDEPTAARYVGYTAYALRLWRAQGRGPAYLRVGRSVRYRIADLDAWIEAHVITPSRAGRSRT